MYGHLNSATGSTSYGSNIVIALLSPSVPVEQSTPIKYGVFLLSSLFF